jgi:hypothetical protein
MAGLDIYGVSHKYTASGGHASGLVAKLMVSLTRPGSIPRARTSLQSRQRLSMYLIA